MLHTEHMKFEQINEVEQDRQEIAKEMALYEEDKQKKRMAEKEKRVKIMEMMQQNILNHRVNQENRLKLEKTTDHLVNPVTFQMMDQEEKLRDQLVKEKKLTDDTINQKTFYSRKFINSKLRKEERKKAQSNEDSFFERLRR